MTRELPPLNINEKQLIINVFGCLAQSPRLLGSTLASAWEFGGNARRLDWVFTQKTRFVRAFAILAPKNRSIDGTPEAKIKARFAVRGLESVLADFALALRWRQCVKCREGEDDGLENADEHGCFLGLMMKA
jgi:hypothetical protein